MTTRQSAAKSRETQSRQKWAGLVYDCRHRDLHTFKRGTCVVCGVAPTVTDSDTGEVFTAAPDEHGNWIIDFSDGTVAVHIGDGIYRVCAA